MQQQKETFSKKERLCSKIKFDALFNEGNRFHSYPFRVVWKFDELEESPAQIAIVAPKKRFRKAVDRNRVKRLTREAYRKNKLTLYNVLNQKNVKIIFLVIYVSDSIMSWEDMNQQMNKLLLKLNSDIENKLINKGGEDEGN